MRRKGWSFQHGSRWAIKGNTVYMNIGGLLLELGIHYSQPRLLMAGEQSQHVSTDYTALTSERSQDHRAPGVVMMTKWVGSPSFTLCTVTPRSSS